MEILSKFGLSGLFIGICTFLIIGFFHPVVVKAEYYWGTRCWWVFLLLGIAGVVASICVENILFSSLLGVFAFSSFWTINNPLHNSTECANFAPLSPKGYTGLVAQLVRATDS